MSRSKRAAQGRETLEILKRGYYINQQGKEIDIADAQKTAHKETILYKPEALQNLIQEALPDSNEEPTKFLVNDLTTLDAVRAEYLSDHNIAYLNFASARNPGGGFLNGAQAQEESLARATGLYHCQLNGEDYYIANRKHDSCLYTDHIIYSPAVPIFREEKGNLMDDFITAAIITAPAVNAGVIKRNEPDNIDKIESYMRRRMDMILAVCKKHRHETLVLGAWGCGVFRNDPIVVASLFYDLLLGKYKDQFKKVVFAVYSKDERFITPFHDRFSNLA